MGIGSRNQPYGDFRCGIEKDRPCPSDNLKSDEKMKGVKMCNLKSRNTNLYTCLLSYKSLFKSQFNIAKTLLRHY